MSLLFIGGLGLKLYYYCNTIVYYGTVVSKDTDAETAMIIDNGDRRYCIDKQYFGTTPLPRTIDLGDIITVVGNCETDQYGRTWLAPSNHYYSGIYTHRHPLSLLSRLRRLRHFISRFTPNH